MLHQDNHTIKWIKLDIHGQTKYMNTNQTEDDSVNLDDYGNSTAYTKRIKSIDVIEHTNGKILVNIMLHEFKKAPQNIYTVDSVIDNSEKMYDDLLNEFTSLTGIKPIVLTIDVNSAEYVDFINHIHHNHEDISEIKTELINLVQQANANDINKSKSFSTMIANSKRKAEELENSSPTAKQSSSPTRTIREFYNACLFYERKAHNTNVITEIIVYSEDQEALIELQAFMSSRFGEDYIIRDFEGKPGNCMVVNVDVFYNLAAYIEIEQTNSSEEERQNKRQRRDTNNQSFETTSELPKSPNTTAPNSALFSSNNESIRNLALKAFKNAEVQVSPPSISITFTNQCAAEYFGQHYYDLNNTILEVNNSEEKKTFGVVIDENAFVLMFGEEEFNRLKPQESAYKSAHKSVGELDW